MPTLLEKAKNLRNNQTEAEKVIWHYLRAHRFKGIKFRRQVIIGKYIVDFLCKEKKIIIEIDGGQHIDQMDYDKKRSEFLESQGYRVIRFWNHEVLNSTESVLGEILRVFEDLLS